MRAGFVFNGAILGPCIFGGGGGGGTKAPDGLLWLLRAIFDFQASRKTWEECLSIACPDRSMYQLYLTISGAPSSH